MGVWFRPEGKMAAMPAASFSCHVQRRSHAHKALPIIRGVEGGRWRRRARCSRRGLLQRSEGAGAAAIQDTGASGVIRERLIGAEERLNGAFCAGEVDLKALTKDAF